MTLESIAAADARTSALPGAIAELDCGVPHRILRLNRAPVEIVGSRI
jgi:hypothetical protein